MKRLTTVLLLSTLAFFTITGCNNKTEQDKSKDANIEETGFELEKIEVKATQPLNINFTLLEDSLDTKPVTVVPDSGRYECAIKINTSANWLIITHPSGASQKHTFPNNRGGNKYKLDFLVTTNLNKDSIEIYDYYYHSLTGGVKDFKQLGIVPDCDDNSLNLKYHIFTHDKKMTGKFVILYTKK